MYVYTYYRYVYIYIHINVYVEIYPYLIQSTGSPVVCSAQVGLALRTADALLGPAEGSKTCGLHGTGDLVTGDLQGTPGDP